MILTSALIGGAAGKRNAALPKIRGALSYAERRRPCCERGRPGKREGPRRGGRPLAILANRILTGLTNLLYRSRLTDMETCYKVCRTDVLRALALESDRFEIAVSR